MKWEVVGKLKNSKNQKIEAIVNLLLKNRNIKNKADFFDPKDPMDITLSEFGIDKKEMTKAVKRINTAKKNKEFVVVYGDYDADGICATAIAWETLYKYGLDVLPYIPDRFTEGYGLNTKSIENLKLKNENLKLIITVDNGIVAHDAVEKANKLGIDVIVCDHHTKEKKKLKAHAIIHTTQISGSGVSWILSREINKSVKDKLELVAIGTIADQLPLLDQNRALVKYGLEQLNNTKRIGLLSLFRGSGIEKIGTYEVGYIIAPRINAMGRLDHGINSLRLLCTNKLVSAEKLAKSMGGVNTERQKIVDEVVVSARTKVTKEKIIVVSGDYHEGVIGLAASKIVEEFYRPAIVISAKGEVSKASARSISGFNIIETIRKLEDLYLEGGGHPMAAGFSIETGKIEEFAKRINEISDSQITDEILEKKLKIDTEIEFKDITKNLYKELEKFDPTGMGNFTPLFCTKDVEVVDTKAVGAGAKHLKLKLKQNGQVFDAIYFGGGEFYPTLKTGSKVDAAYSIEENTWNGNTSLQLKVRDIELTV